MKKVLFGLICIIWICSLSTPAFASDIGVEYNSSCRDIEFVYARGSGTARNDTNE